MIHRILATKKKERKKRMAVTAHMNNGQPVQCQHVMPSSAKPAAQCQKVLALFTEFVCFKVIFFKNSFFSKFLRSKLCFYIG
jgi:hypothetical protein